MERLFVYGHAASGREKCPHSGNYRRRKWLPGWCIGTFYARGWGAAADFQVSSLIKTVPGSTYLFIG